MRINWGTQSLSILAGVLCVAAIGAVLLAAAMGRSDILLIAAIFMLGLAQLAGLMLGRADNRDAALRTMAADLNALERRVGILTEIRVPVKAPAPQGEVPVASGAGLPDAPAPSETPTDQLDFYLEPMVDLSSGRTAHYRASIMLRMADGMRIGMESVQRGAERAGVRPLLETLTLARALPALRRLQERGRSAMIFAPASAASFASEDFLARVEEILDAGSQIAASIVLDVNEAALAELSEEGMQGVTRLAERGVNFCLSGASGYGPVPGTLATLGFRFVMVEADLLKGDGFNDFAQGCLDAGLEVVAAHVDTREQLSQLQGYTSLGFGTLFAPPRLVRDMRGHDGAVAA